MKFTFTLFLLFVFSSCQNESTSIKIKSKISSLKESSPFKIPSSFLIQSKKYKVNPLKDTLLAVGSGQTILHIPENCFVDNDGKIINKEVVLKFTEYTNSAEIAFSGIPMTYTNENEELYFNSSGMFNIEGESKGSSVHFNKNKAITIDYELAKKNADIDFYRLTDEKKWVMISEIEPKKLISKPIKVVEKKKIVQKKKIVKQEKLIEPKKPIKRDVNDSRVISIAFDDKEIFPELQHYENVKFRICEKSNYNPNDADSKWYSINLEKTKKKAEYIVSFIGVDNKNKTIKRNYFVNPVFEGEDYDKAIIDYNEKFELFKGKKITQQKLLAIELQRQEEEIKKEEKRQEEMMMKNKLRKNKFKSLSIKNGGSLTKGQDPGHTYPDIVKGLAIKGFGTYNCDQVYRLKHLISLTPLYVDQSGNEIEFPGVLSVINKNVNAAYSFDPKRIIFDLEAENVFLLFTEFGKLYILDKNELKKDQLISGVNIVFKMKEVTNKIKNTNELASFLGK